MKMLFRLEAEAEALAGLVMDNPVPATEETGGTKPDTDKVSRPGILKCVRQIAFKNSKCCGSESVRIGII